MMQFFVIKPAISSSSALLILADIDAILATTAKSSIVNRHKHQGSLACRLLLQSLFFANNSDFEQNFDEAEFPYKLTLPNLPICHSPQLIDFLQDTHASSSSMPAHCYISFSHSRKNVAILLSRYTSFGVDIEDKVVSIAVSHRYFLTAELHWVQTLPVDKQAMGRKLLWTLKESLIKAQNAQKSQLVAGLKINTLNHLTCEQMTNLVESKLDNHIDGQFYQVLTTTHVFGFSPKWQCGFCIEISID